MGNINVEVAFRGHDWANSFYVKTPDSGGRPIVLHCNGKWQMFSIELEKLVGSVHWADGSVQPWGVYKNVTVSSELVKEVLHLSENDTAYGVK